MNIKEGLDGSVSNQTKNSAPSTETPLPDNITSPDPFSQVGRFITRHWKRLVLGATTVGGLAYLNLTEASSPDPNIQGTPTPTPTRLILPEDLSSKQSLIKNAEIIRNAAKTEILSSPPNPYFWTDNSGNKIRDVWNNAAHGIYPYNNPDRPVAEVYRWINTPGTEPNITWQPWEGVYPETQAGPGVSLGILGLLADGAKNKEYLLTFVHGMVDNNVDYNNQGLKLSIEIIRDANNPTDYSHNGRLRVTEGLPQRYLYSAGLKITSYRFGLDTANKKYLEVGFENEYVATDKGLYRAYLDDNGNLLPFILVPPTEPTRTPTAVPPTATPTVVFRTFNLYLPIAGKDFQHKQ